MRSFAAGFSTTGPTTSPRFIHYFDALIGTLFAGRNGNTNDFVVISDEKLTGCVVLRIAIRTYFHTGDSVPCLNEF